MSRKKITINSIIITHFIIIVLYIYKDINLINNILRTVFFYVVYRTLKKHG